MEITHDIDNNKFLAKVDGYIAYVTYRINAGQLDIRHTIVPPKSEAGESQLN